ncbi:YhcH/YjgK/YiaL family protein [Collinsella sp. zg1085]|uniref:YhcH/YjgK/YiaL family protein n=1 Tax=Collinsella sp. zg1085 TaxID=2844380 RepID=UPI001C0D3791|nr:YhcH/YjgK/YiaL family protein [Collinsella sp. zg1085]QWT17472.1 YhcH/YjgK/YiaL family protein [Collinsella sp. zg1085]
MVYDGLSALGLYRGLTRGLDVLIDWLEEHNLSELPLGRTDIDGNRVFANVMQTSTKLLEDAHFEIHHRYLDVQVDLDGVERVRTTPSAVVPTGPFDELADKGYCDAAADNTDVLEGSLAQGHFAIFMVNEPHMPNLAPAGEEPAPLKKVCFKVLADAFWDEI